MHDLARYLTELLAQCPVTVVEEEGAVRIDFGNGVRLAYEFDYDIRLVAGIEIVGKELRRRCRVGLQPGQSSRVWYRGGNHEELRRLAQGYREAANVCELLDRCELEIRNIAMREPYPSDGGLI